MYIVIEKSPHSHVKTEYHIINAIQMKQFIIEKKCDEVISSEDFETTSFGNCLEAALNDCDQDNQYEVVHVWLN